MRYEPVVAATIAMYSLRTFCIRRSVGRFASNGGRGSVSEQYVQGQLPFSGARIGQFFQAEPQLGNQYEMDYALKSYLTRVMPAEVEAF